MDWQIIDENPDGTVKVRISDDKHELIQDFVPDEDNFNIKQGAVIFQMAVLGTLDPTLLANIAEVVNGSTNNSPIN